MSFIFVIIIMEGKVLMTSVAWLQMTPPTSGGAVTADTNCCENCAGTSRPSNGGPIYRFSASRPCGTAGWLACSSQKRVMSRQNQVRLPHTNESGFAISAINNYMFGNRYSYGVTGLNTGYTSDVQVSANNNTQIPGPTIYTDNPDPHLTLT